ncbi:MAG: M23 family metallopeptidase [Prosthecochloris sp.]|nr:M23 family metallopeptidase [Prosthecochloris sp.]
MKKDYRPLFHRPGKRVSFGAASYIRIFLIASLVITGAVYVIERITSDRDPLYSTILNEYEDELGITDETDTVEIEEGEPVSKNTLVTGNVKRGESLYLILTAHGLSPADIQTLSGELKGKFSVKSLKSGQAYQIEKDPNGEFLSFSLKESRARTLHLERSPEPGRFHVWQEVLDYDIRLATLSGTISSNLSLELQKQQRYSLISQLQNLFSWKINFNRDIHPGTTYRVLFEEKWIGDEYISSGNVMAAEIGLDGQQYTAYRFTDSNGKTAYYDEKGQSLSGFFLSQPCNYTRISSGYGYRTHPILKRRHFHGGVDYAAPAGTPVYAVADGKIVFRGRKGAAGNMVTIAHANGYHTKYLHLSRFARNAPYGSRVKQGEVIGYVGSTGRSTGAHLDFRVVHNGKTQDPLKALRAAGTRTTVAKNEMQNFMAQLSVFRAQLDETGVLVADVAKTIPESPAALN